MVLGERHLRRILEDYFGHYHRWRCHQSLQMDCPEPRAVQPPEAGQVVEIREAGGLYRHCFLWWSAFRSAPTAIT